jgi:excisionase family DNA binding protein
MMLGVDARLDMDLMTPAEVAVLFRVHRNTIGRWVEAGTLKGFRIPGTKTLRIAVVDVVALIERDPDDDQLAGDLAAWLNKRDVDRESELCPRCAVRSIDVKSAHGWCINCTTEAQIADDEARERERARKRRWWEENGTEWRASTRKKKGKKADAK